jgi:hypothetical protein
MNNEEISELARLLPVPAQRDLPANRKQALSEHLMTEYRIGGQAAARPRRRIRRPVLATAGVGILSLATAISFILVSAANPASSSASAATLLSKIASAAERQPAPAVRDSQYEYVKIIEKRLPIGPQPVNGRIPAAEAPLTRAQFDKLLDKAVAEGRYITTTNESWSSVSDVCRAGLERTQGNAGTPFTAQESGQKSGCPSMGSLNDSTYRLLQTLPTNPQALLALINKEEQGHGPSAVQEEFVTIGDLLRGKVAPPQVSAALYHAAALIPGVTIDPHAVDAIGRHGIAVALALPDSPGVTCEWIFNNNTLQVLGERTITNGHVVDVTAFLRHAFVDQVGQTPSSK